MIFVHSRKDTYKTAKSLIEMAQQENMAHVFDCREDPRYHARVLEGVAKSPFPRKAVVFKG